MTARTALEDLFLAQGAPEAAPDAARRWIEIAATQLGGQLNPLRYHAVVWHAKRGKLAALFLAILDFSGAEDLPPRRHSVLASRELGHHRVAFDAALAALTNRTGRPETAERLRDAFMGLDPLARCNAAAVLAILLAVVWA